MVPPEQEVRASEVRLLAESRFESCLTGVHLATLKQHGAQIGECIGGRLERKQIPVVPNGGLLVALFCARFGCGSECG